MVYTRPILSAEQMSDRPPNNTRPRSLLRTLIAVLLGLAGSVIVWVASPYNTFVMRSQYIADSYLPIAVLFITFLLVLVVNPLFRWLWPRIALNRPQLALAIGVMLVASVVPSSGLLRQLPYAVAKVPTVVAKDEKLATVYKKMKLPSSLFPSKIGYEEEVPEAKHFIEELPKGGQVPWKAWVGPLLSWGTFTLFCWMMMIGLSLIVLPQWRRNERLPFPLLTVHNALIEEPEQGGLFAAIFHKRSFWIAAGVVFMLHFLSGMRQYYPNSVPAVPIQWNLGRVFAGTLLRHVPGHIRSARIYFILLGITYFMPNRIGFSIWFFELAYGLYRCIGVEYFPPFHYSTIYEHRVGSMFTLTIFILWLGRTHWAKVLRADSRSASPEERRDLVAGTLFAAGCAGMYLWLLWAGVQPLWALFYVGIGFMTSLLIARLVAETGTPFIRIDFRYSISLVKLAPVTWLNAASLYFATVIAMLFPTASRVSATTMGSHALGLDEHAGPRHQSRLAVFLILVMVAGLVISGAVHVYANYHHSMSLDGGDRPLSPWGTSRITQKAHPDLKEWNDWQNKTGKKKDQFNQPAYNRWGHLGFGAALAAVCQWGCLTMPRWPFHPIGLVMNATYYANVAWASILFGWLLKIILVKYGGARLYRAARPLFLGIILGEVFAAVYWSIDPAVRVLLGLPYKIVQVLPR